MNEYIINKKTLPLNDSWDVIVVGGGPAGCAAAIAAAREGANTLLIESTGCLGGMGTAGLVPAWCPFSDKEKIIYRSIALKVFEESKRRQSHVQKGAMDWVSIDPEGLKVIYDELVCENGVEVLFFTTLCDVDVSDKGEIKAIIASNKSGLTAYSAKVYVDCTGDADLAAWAGAPTEKSKINDMQPATYCFSLGNVDEYAYRYGPRMHGSHSESPVHKILEEKRYPLITDDHICNNITAPREIGFNAGHLWGVDNTDVKSVSEAMILGRRMAYQYQKALSEYHPKAFGSAFVSKTAQLMGIRETRRIVGDYVLTVDDYVNRQSFEDEIGRSSYYIDAHSSSKEIADNNVKRPEKYGKGESYGIPYRSLIPKGLNNLLVAGRSISSDKMMQGSVRVMPVCLVTGEAAGTAAAMAADATKDVRKVNSNNLREKLKGYGAYFN